jgi:spermidine synthase
MPASLFIEQRPQGLAFYINGDLQFDTTDEAVYHEYLVVPAIALAVQRFPNTPLRVLICGGGDGLAARDVLRFAAVAEVILVDYSPEVLELGRTVFSPYNQGSLLEETQTTLGASRITVHTQEAFEFVAGLPDRVFHVVICDFTSPTSAQETQIYSREWFTQIVRVLHPSGVMAENAVSPEQTPAAFWCLYQTLLAAGLPAKPMQIPISSFRDHEYGDWGFFLASPQPIARMELETLQVPEGLQAFEPDAWLRVFRFPKAIAAHRHRFCIHTLECPQLFYYLLNSQIPESGEGAIVSLESAAWIDFLDIQEPGTGLIGTLDLLQLDAMAKVWLERVRASANPLQDPSVWQAWEPLIPARHAYHNPTMTREWLGYLRSLLSEIDLNRLLSSLSRRAQELPPKIAQEVKQLSEKIRTGQPLTYVSEHTTELIVVLSVTLLMANLTHPDSVFAKGFSGFSSRRSRYHSSGSSYGTNTYNDGQFGWFGFWTMLIGGIWLFNLYRDREE